MACSSIQQLFRSREQLIHTSAPIGYKPNPAYNPQLSVSQLNLPAIPFVVQLGKAGVHNSGKNKAKRAARLRAAVSK